MTSFSAFQIFNQSLMSNHNKYFFHLLLLFFTIWFILIKRVCVNSEFVKTYIPEKIWWMALVQKSRVYLGILVVKCKLKWPILSQTSTEGSGKNKRSWFFLSGFKYTLRTCFESINFLPKSCPELSNQVLSFSEGQIY